MSLILVFRDYFKKKKVKFNKNEKIELPYDPALLLLVLCSKDTQSVLQREICIFMYSTALFIIATI